MNFKWILFTKIRFENGSKIKLTLQETINKLHAANDFEALLIKQIDRLHNLHTISKKSADKQIETALETQHSLIMIVGYIFDRLNITNTLNLENKLFQYCRNILLKKHTK